tara:strand:- start:86 stop:928 length:843 start_codon:yes stop_codon:yes gene_type:complete
MDSFRDYGSVIQSLAADPTKNDNTRTLAESKEKAADTYRGLGEAKTFISSRSLVQKVQAGLKKKGEDLAKKGEQAVKDKLEKGLGQVKDKVNQKVDDVMKGAKEDESKLAPKQDVAADNAGKEGTSDGIGEGDEDPAPRAPAAEEGTGEIGADEIEETAPVEETSFMDAPDAGVTAGDLPEGAGGGADAGTDLSGLGARTATKEGLEETGEAAAKEGAELGGEEAASGLLDMIPGLDVLGIIGGAVLAGVAGRKAKAQQKAASQIPPRQSVNQSFQVGLE